MALSVAAKPGSAFEGYARRQLCADGPGNHSERSEREIGVVSRGLDVDVGEGSKHDLVRRWDMLKGAKDEDLVGCGCGPIMDLFFD